MTEPTHDPLLHEIATTLRDLALALVRYEQAATRGETDAAQRLRVLMEGADEALGVLDKVVAREGDIIPSPPGGPERWT